MNTTLGHFITFELWIEAMRLLDFQVRAKRKNRHFANLSNFYYERLGSTIRTLQEQVYFDEKIASNLFYGLEKEFKVFPYVIPKASLGLRNYRFFTYPLRALYYSIGLYLRKISDDFLSGYYKRRVKIRSYYGGSLQFNDDALVINSRSIYFLEHYRQFKRDMRGQLKDSSVDDRVVVRLDIQNYYDCISIPILLEKLTKHCKQTILVQGNFDAITRDQIVSFFRYLMSGRDGIPQADNDLVSSFIGFLYLTFADLFIEDQLKEMVEVADYQLIRYTDDMAICVTFRSGVSQEVREQIVESLASRIADLLYYELGLRLNTKTRMYWLGKDDDRIDFEKSLKKVSPQYQVADDGDDDPNAIVSNILSELVTLKNSHLTAEFQHERQDEILKQVYDKRVRQLLSKPSNLKQIGRIFHNFNFGLVRVNPIPIMIVLLHDPNASSNFQNYLLAKENITTSDVNLMLTYLCQTDFRDTVMLERLKKYDHMREIVARLEEGNLSLDTPGYYALAPHQVRKLSSLTHVTEQIRLRALSEREYHYSVALNHLLNEFHAICFHLDTANKTKPKSYDADRVAAFLEAQNVPNSTCVEIVKLFDRRNANQVSHPGSVQSISWGVDEKEYYDYKRVVGEALQKLL